MNIISSSLTSSPGHLYHFNQHLFSLSAPFLCFFFGHFISSFFLFLFFYFLILIHFLLIFAVTQFHFNLPLSKGHHRHFNSISINLVIGTLSFFLFFFLFFPFFFSFSFFPFYFSSAHFLIVFTLICHCILIFHYHQAISSPFQTVLSLLVIHTISFTSFSPFLLFSSLPPRFFRGFFHL